MACAKPVVASAAGGIPEVVADGETGILVKPRDHEAMARALVALLSDDQARRTMGKAGLRRVREHFSVERMVGETLRVYRELVSS
jgi:glycosyltransferase involved in cell wall biosynthesis